MTSGALLSLWLCAAASPPPVPAQWMADLTLYTDIAPTPPFTTPGVFAYDTVKQRQYYSSISDMSAIAPQAWAGTLKALVVVEEWVVADGMFAGLNSREYLQSTKGFNVTSNFAWVPYAQYTGNATINGTLTSEYTSASAAGTFTYYCLPDGTPVRQILNITQPPEYRRFDFSNVRALDASVFNTFDKTAAYSPPICPVQEVTPITVDMYIFHPRADVNITGQDTADIIGDTAFVCLDAMSNTTAVDHYDVVSWYRVQVLPVWGQYQPCNGYPSSCIGGTRFYVGRETAFGLTPYGGQCSDDDLAAAGTWWSLSAAGECKGAGTPGDGSCSWKVVERVKTIDAVQCLFTQQKMLDSCEQEKRMPFSQTQKIFRTAFTESDVSKGGCPAIQP